MPRNEPLRLPSLFWAQPSACVGQGLGMGSPATQGRDGEGQAAGSLQLQTAARLKVPSPPCSPWQAQRLAGTEPRGCHSLSSGKSPAAAFQQWPQCARALIMPSTRILAGRLPREAGAFSRARTERANAEQGLLHGRVTGAGGGVCLCSLPVGLYRQGCCCRILGAHLRGEPELLVSLRFCRIRGSLPQDSTCPTR